MSIAALLPLEDVKPAGVPGGEHVGVLHRSGVADVLDVPIFCEFVVTGEGKKIRLTREWMVEAVLRARRREQLDDYLPPLHLNHHHTEREVGGAGFFRLRGVRLAEYQGEMLWTMFADFVAVPLDVYDRIRRTRLPYRSVEIHDVRKPEIDSLALMEDEVPFYRLSLLTIGREVDGEIGMAREVEGPEGVPVPIAARALGVHGVSLLFAECRPGQTAEKTGCTPKGRDGRGLRALAATGKEAAVEALRAAPGAVREKIGAAAESARKVGGLLRGIARGEASAADLKDAAVGMLRGVGEAADGLAAPLIEEGIPPTVAKGVAIVAALDSVMPVTITSAALLAIQGPTAVANPLFWTPGFAEAGAIIAAAKFGPRAARAITSLMSRRREKAEKVTMAKFTPEERRCISSKIRTLRDEGMPQAQAVAVAISKCAPGKARKNAAAAASVVAGIAVRLAVRDPNAVCGEIWVRGTGEQRSAFGGGTEGRGRDERPPKAWFDD